MNYIETLKSKGYNLTNLPADVKESVDFLLANTNIRNSKMEALDYMTFLAIKETQPTNYLLEELNAFSQDENLDTNNGFNTIFKSDQDPLFKRGGTLEQKKNQTFENDKLQVRIIGGDDVYYKPVNEHWETLTPEETAQLKYGAKHELEHSHTIGSFVREGVPIKIVATFIAWDHILENLYYYKELDKALPETQKFGKGDLIDPIRNTYATRKYLAEKYPYKLMDIGTIHDEARKLAKKEIEALPISVQLQEGLMTKTRLKFVEMLEQKQGGVRSLFGGHKVYFRLGYPKHTHDDNKKIQNSVGWNAYTGTEIFEKGVSVFEGEYMPDIHKIVLDELSSKEELSLGYAFDYGRPIYLVEGKETGRRGADGEPLLEAETLEVIGELSLVDFDNELFEYAKSFYRKKKKEI